jgi:hypothetical protein
MTLLGKVFLCKVFKKYSAGEGTEVDNMFLTYPLTSRSVIISRKGAFKGRPIDRTTIDRTYA